MRARVALGSLGALGALGALACVVVVVASACPAVAPGGDEGEGEGAVGEGEGAAGEGEGAAGEGEGAAGEGEGAAGEGEGVAGEGEGAAAGEGEGEGAAGDFGPYDSAGPVAFTTADIDVDASAAGGGHFTEHTWIPTVTSSVTGPFPVVSISPGLQQSAAGYAPYAERLASHGFVVVAFDDPGAFTQTPEVVTDITFVVDTWLAAENDDNTSPLFGLVDTTRVGLMGHSRGGKATLVAAAHGLLGVVNAWFGLDPVDASTGANDISATSGVASVGIPLAFLKASVSTSCSPAADNADVIFASAVAPAVELVGVGADHTDFEDPAHCLFCGLCAGGTADQPTVEGYAVRYSTAFFARELLGDSDVGATFAGAGEPLDESAGLVTVTSK